LKAPRFEPWVVRKSDPPVGVRKGHERKSRALAVLDAAALTIRRKIVRD
jgi:hypothetical protein